MPPLQTDSETSPVLRSHFALGKNDLICQVTLLAGLTSYTLLDMEHVWDYPTVTLITK